MESSSTPEDIMAADKKKHFFYTHEEAGQSDSDVRRHVLKLDILWR